MLFREATEYISQKLTSELPAYLSYHSASHVTDVVAAAEHLANQENISESDMKLLLTAAWYHDAGFLSGPKDHEEQSCRIVKETLPRYGYDIVGIETICGMIMATKIPQSPQSHLEQILADADLDYLGRDDFFVIADTLFDELKYFDVVQTQDDWDRLQVSFLENHHYFTNSAIKLRQSKKDGHLMQLKAKLNK